MGDMDRIRFMFRNCLGQAKMVGNMDQFLTDFFWVKIHGLDCKLSVV